MGTKTRHIPGFVCAMLTMAAIPWGTPTVSAAEGGESPWLVTPILSNDPKLGTTLGAVLGYLHRFDEAMTRRGWTLVRYADDWCVVTRSRAEAERARLVARQILSRLRLSLNDDKTRILPLDEGFTFLGVRFRADG